MHHYAARKEASTNRYPARHAGHADTTDPGTRSRARTYHCLRDRAAFGRGSTGGTRVTLSRAAPPGRPRLDRLVLGHLGEQPQGALLPPYGRGAEAVKRGDEPLGTR